MELFTYLMAKNDHNTSVNKDLFSYLLGKNQSGTYQEFTGTSISANNTKKGKMKVNLLGNTSQFTTTGKNLYNDNFSDYTQPRDYRIFPITLEQGQTYALRAQLIGTKVTGCIVGIVPYGEKYSDFSGVMTNCVGTDGTPYNRTFTPNETFTSPKLIVYANNKATFNSLFENYQIQLEEGETATDYEPYTYGASPNPQYPQDIHTINGDNTIKVEGQQLFQNEYIGTPTSAPNSVLEAGTYTIASCDSNNFGTNIYFRLLDMNNNPINESGHITSSNTDINFSTSSYFYLGGSTKSYITFTLDNDYKVGIGLLSSDSTRQVMLVKGSNAVRTFEPYKQNAVLLTLGDKEICKIGNYEDKIFKAIKGNEIYDSLASEEKATLDYGKWYLRKNVGKVVLDGSETITTTTYSAGAYYHNIRNIGLNGTNNDYAISNYYSYSSSYMNNTCKTANSGKDIITRDNFDNSTYVTWLGTNKPIFYYYLATPTNELFNDTIQDQLEDIYYNMLSYEGQTNISQVNNDLPFNMDVSVKVGS